MSSGISDVVSAGGGDSAKLASLSANLCVKLAMNLNPGRYDALVSTKSFLLGINVFLAGENFL